MTGLPFAGGRRAPGRRVTSQPRAANPIRLKGLVEHKVQQNGCTHRGAADHGQPDELPFGSRTAQHRTTVISDGWQTAQQVAEDPRVDLPLALIVITRTGNFKDANDAAEGQRVMNRLADLSRRTGAFVLAVDHFGKMVETGTRGSSSKEAAADVVLALLADRQINGTISNMTMAVRKLRGGAVGIETPFDLEQVDVGEGRTTCVVVWKVTRAATQARSQTKDRWPKALRIFKTAMETAVIEHGKAMRPYGSEDPEVRAVAYDDVRSEFVKSYAADGSDAKDKANTKWKAFTRALKTARDVARAPKL
jgi:hypothetical protein